MEIKIKAKNIDELRKVLGVTLGEDKKIAPSVVNNEEKALGFSEIQEILDNENEALLHVGQEVTDYAPDGDVVYEIADIDKESHSVIFIRKYAMEEEHEMDENCDNNYEKSSMRHYLNTEVYNSMSEELKKLLARRKFLVGRGGRSKDLDVIEDKVFLPREAEVFGKAIYSSEEEARECHQWEIFKKTKNRIKTVTDDFGNAWWYWLVSPYASASTYFCLVNTSGAPSYYDASSSRGVVPCFQLSKRSAIQ